MATRSLIRFSALATAALALTSCAAWRVDRAVQTATGLTSHWLCDDVYVSGLDAATAYAERVQPQPGMGLVDWGLRWQLDPAARQVTVSVAGGFESRAVHRPGLGCVALPAGETPAPAEPAPVFDAVQASQPPIAGPALVETTNPALAAALTRALQPDRRHQTKAVLVLRDGRLIAERYAPGIGVDTPLLGFSMTKTTVNALVGILVRQGRLNVDAPAPVPAWADAADPRHAITVAQLLRQTSGLDLPQNNSGFDPSTQILYSVRDKAAAITAAPLAAAPGTRHAYADPNYLLLSRIVRDQAGGSAHEVLRFAQRELFGPLGMARVTLDIDATGTPVGAAHMLAPARDWARLGQLYLDDGMAGPTRILPAGWVGWSTTPTLATGYGAGLWTNRLGAQRHPDWGVPWGLANAPADAFFARGFMGQFIVVIPSERLVIVRLSVSHTKGDDIEETDRIVGEVRAALN
ncbi:MAG TPA: serine hydrolase [Rhizobacter sp.]|nr:serine hydrolase [Rhizobacter sp.]